MATDNEDCGAANIFINATSQRTPKLENIWLVNDYDYLFMVYTQSRQVWGHVSSVQGC